MRSHYPGHNTTDLISVIIIFYNAQAFIQQAVKSVQNQTYPGWEIIFVDDGSTDDSPAIASQYERLDPQRFRLLQHSDSKNHGTAASRNLGIKAARGEFIAFLDADDLYAANRLDRHLTMFKQFPKAVMVQSLLYYSHAREGGETYDIPETPVIDAQMFLFQPPDLLELLVGTNGATCPGCCSYTLRTRAVLDVGGIDPSFKDAYEDQVLLAKIYLYGPVVYLQEYLAWYRQHEDSLLHRMNRSGLYKPGHAHPSRRAFLEWLDRYLAQHGAEKVELRQRVSYWLHIETSRFARLKGDWPNALAPLLRLFSHHLLPEGATQRLALWWGQKKMIHARHRVHKISSDLIQKRKQETKIPR